MCNACLHGVSSEFHPGPEGVLRTASVSFGIQEEARPSGSPSFLKVAYAP